MSEREQAEALVLLRLWLARARGQTTPQQVADLESRTSKLLTLPGPEDETPPPRRAAAPVKRSSFGGWHGQRRS